MIVIYVVGNFLLIDFIPVVSFLAPENIRKRLKNVSFAFDELSFFQASGFLMFSGGLERDQWHEMI